MWSSWGGGPGLCPTPIGTTLSSVPSGVPSPPTSALFPTYLSRVRRGEGPARLGGHPTPNTFRISCQTGPSVSLGPRILFGGRDLPSFLTQGMQQGGVPPEQMQ